MHLPGRQLISVCKGLKENVLMFTICKSGFLKLLLLTILSGLLKILGFLFFILQKEISNSWSHLSLPKFNFYKKLLLFSVISIQMINWKGALSISGF